ncbi:ShlB/FhaC/HecB family hemolysin secretion/activation protein [Chitinimonas viridis]|uniref:ShlB/FhaC/HecB family hemolysin secretion/activation protein n=1 Tax=Chitinimonas viridis TaxID=664880 RepID=A0ABT8B3Z2_9NEIS|nr:ShlB/FhaC/HecB family hemolysin secretion/activation protein [Chitinimonas viridis]MDN3576386.1 ShlB/FhaC/HecB family hemolysin secretion/activation protein [Chitinimonas viridis]
MKSHLAALLLACTTVAAAEETLRFSINQYKVEGNTVLPDARIQATLAPFAGQGRDFADVQRALEALETLYRKAGYGALQVYLPEQEMNQGTIVFKVVEPKLGKVRIEGNQYYGEGNIRRALPALREGDVPNTGSVTDSLRLANESPARRLTVTLQAGETPQTVDASVKVADERPWRVFAQADNTGSKETGEARLSLGYQHSNLFDLDHVLTTQFTTSPSEADKVKIFGIGYRVPFYGWGDSLSLFGGYSNVESAALAGLFNVTGKGTVFGARYTQGLPAEGALQHKLQWGLDWRRFNTRSTFGGGNTVGSNRYTVQPVSLAYQGQWQNAKSSYDWSAGLSRNLPGGDELGQTGAGLSKSGRLTATTEYTIARLGGNAYISLPAEWTAHVGMNAQLTPDALAPGEQFGLGGANSVRGYDEREFANDEGVNLTLEAYTPDFAKRWGWESMTLRGLVFLDWGRITRNDVALGEIDSTELAGAGIGLRLGWGKRASIKLDIAQTLKEGQQDGQPKKKGDTKAHVSAIVSY